MLRASSWVTIAALTVVTACGSSSTTPTTNCTPGQSVACTGAGGCAGGQACTADGAGFGACQCAVDSGITPDAASDATTPIPHTTGKPCSTDAVCTGPGEKCSNDSFGSDTILPSPVCVSTGCVPGAMDCNAGTGACAPDYAKGVAVCSGACTFDATSGAAATGCTGKDLCRYVGYTKSAQKVVSGVGACLAGCTSNGACTGGNTCQPETGECVASFATMTKSVGSACTVGDPACLCAPPNKGTVSFCTSFCVVGGSACTAGFSCDPGLPATELVTNDVLFTKTPTGMAGLCVKNCTIDADCTASNGYCDPSGGLAGKVCHPGVR